MVAGGVQSDRPHHDHETDNCDFLVVQKSAYTVAEMTDEDVRQMLEFGDLALYVTCQD